MDRPFLISGLLGFRSPRVAAYPLPSSTRSPVWGIVQEARDYDFNARKNNDGVRSFLTAEERATVAKVRTFAEAIGLLKQLDDDIKPDGPKGDP